jgi:hypothetical protein
VVVFVDFTLTMCRPAKSVIVSGKYAAGSMIVEVSDDAFDWKRFKRNMFTHGISHFDKNCPDKNLFFGSVSSITSIIKKNVGHYKPALVRYGERHPNTYTVTYKCDHIIGGIKEGHKIIKYTSAIDVVISKTAFGYWAVTYALPSYQFV